MINDRNQEQIASIQSNLLGPQGGWSSGRSQNIF